MSSKLKLRPVVISGPSGAGKSTMLKRLQKEYPGVIGFSVSHTTRAPREGEVDGVSYHFTTREEIDAAIARGEFIEHATFSGNTYGTSRQSVVDVDERNQICVFDIELNGCESLRKTDLDPLFITIKPPSLEILEERLRSRGTETEESLQKRLTQAKDAIAYGDKEGNFHHVIENNDFEEAYREFKAALKELIEKAQKCRAAEK